MPLISVIVPIYNADKYLHKCLNSLLSQTVDDFEVILIDDGSTDSSGSICDDYARQDNRFIVVHKNNEGLSAARNDGIALAKGKWITFLDSDDWIEDHFFNILDKHSDVDYIIASYSLHRRNGDRIDERFSQYKCYSIDDKLFLKNNFKIGFFTAWGKFFKTSIIKDNKLNFEAIVSPGEDTIFVFQYINLINSYIISEIPCYNWLEANGLTNRKRNIDCIIYTIDLTIDSIENLENKFHIDLSMIKYNSLLYLLSKINIKKASFKALCNGFRQMSTKKWFIDLVHEKNNVKKGRQRKLIDFLMLNRLHIPLTILCKFSNRFYL